VWVYYKPTFRKNRSPRSSRVEETTRTRKSVRRLLISSSLTLFFANVFTSTLKIEATRSSETSVYNKPTRRHIQEYGFLHSHRRENLKSYVRIIGQNISYVYTIAYISCASHKLRSWISRACSQKCGLSVDRGTSDSITSKDTLQYAPQKNSCKIGNLHIGDEDNHNTLMT
jgi:hypothetical protein